MNACHCLYDSRQSLKRKISPFHETEGNYWNQKERGCSYIPSIKFTRRVNKSTAFSKSTVRKRSKKKWNKTKLKHYYTSHLHSVDSDIFYAMIHLPARFRDLHLPLFLKVESNQGVLSKLRFKSTPPTSNNALSEHWVGFLCSLAPTQKTRTTQWCDILR